MPATSAVVLAAALALAPAPAPVPTYVLGGTGLPGMSLSDAEIDGIAHGIVAGGRELVYPHSVVLMDMSIKIGAQAIVDTIVNAEGPVRIAGISQGALAISEAKRMIMAMPEEQRPAWSDVTFIAFGDPSSPTGLGSRLPGIHLPILGGTFWPAPESPYDTIFITREYDGFADFPDRPLNLIATANAIAGILYVHPFYGDEVDLDQVPVERITDRINGLGGRETSYLIGTEHLPLLQPLRDLGVDERIVEAIETPLRQVVDAGYSRNDSVETPGPEPRADAPTDSSTDDVDQGDSDAGRDTHGRRHLGKPLPDTADSEESDDDDDGPSDHHDTDTDTHSDNSSDNDSSSDTDSGGSTAGTD
ncbi:PE-PPE domain-containing protein [Mycolicibacterium mengxianglii]|uniref:PE-PPE domain-containing protein n=1 Tax=Mycolicibacterium mengxianglii TaxID=2736649 RepID=UPI0018D08B31|nr:PE-PPE domain-containing protein [Mycolicibacterium mengxianglii]